MKGKVDLSTIQVKLVTVDGMEKHSTQCAPNGYYFIPVYDMGTYTLQIEAKDGWALCT